MTIAKHARRVRCKMPGTPVEGGDKLPYRVPSMQEIQQLRQNGYRVCSTFSGCGGSSLGFRMAGYRVLYANEFVDAARESYAANAAPYTIIDPRDVRTVTPGEILEAAKLRPGELEVLEGSPPCSSFSAQGNREQLWGVEKEYSDTAQRTDDLFFEFVRLLRVIRPKVFVAENVAGLVQGKARGFFLEIYRALTDCGYVVNARLLDAEWLGVPQHRRRLIFMGVRSDLGRQPIYPKPLKHRYSLREAIGDLVVEGPKVTRGPEGNVASADYDGSLVGYCTEAEWRRLYPGDQSARYFNLIRARWDLPCPTMSATNGIAAGSAAPAHPDEPRKFMVPELKRICSFPDDFVLTGKFGQQCERLGRAVPPLMMRAIAESVTEVLGAIPPA